MKVSFLVLMLVFIQACASPNIGATSSEVASGDYNPLTTENVNADRYRMDKATCYKQVQEQSDLKMSESYNKIKFRECLIQKGYILLS